jgi:hypothetical protein
MACCCADPAPPGTGNIDVNPQFLADGLHLAAPSPCIGAGKFSVVSGTDIDGQPWNNPPSMGAQEVNPDDLAGPLSVAIQSPQTTFLVGRSWNFTGQITGRAASLAWAWGDGSAATNVSYATTHAWTNTGNYTLTFTAYNNDNPAGVSVSTVITVVPLTVPQLQSAMLLTNGFHFQFAGQTGADYTIQSTTNLAPPVTWNSLRRINNSTGGLYQITDSAAANAAEFCRVLAQ